MTYEREQMSLTGCIFIYLCIFPGKISYSAANWVMLKLALPMPESSDISSLAWRLVSWVSFPSRFNVILNKLEHIFIYF